MPGIKSLSTCKFVKIQIFKAFTRTVLTCGCESWKLSLNKEELLNSLKGNNLKGISGPARENGMIIIKHNEEL